MTIDQILWYGIGVTKFVSLTDKIEYSFVLTVFRMF